MRSSLLDMRDEEDGNEEALFYARDLQLSDIRLSTVQIGVTGITALSLHPYITSLSLLNVGLRAEGARILSLSTSTALSHLDLSNNKIGDQGATALASNTRLTSLILYGSSQGITKEGAKALAGNSSLTSLVLSFNRGIQEDGILIRPCSVILLVHSLLRGVIALARASALRYLFLDRIPIAVGAARALALNTSITFLSLAQSDMDDGAALVQPRFPFFLSLAFVLCASSTLLSYNAQALFTNATLTALDLSDTHVGNGAPLAPRHLRPSSERSPASPLTDSAAVLARNRSIRSINLRRSEITAPGAAQLATSSSLSFLNLSSCAIGEGGLALAKNTNLTSLLLSDAEVTNNGVEALAKNTSLTVLSLRGRTSARLETVRAANASIALNRQRMLERRARFESAVVLLALDSIDAHSQSLWRRFPPDIRRLILFALCDRYHSADLCASPAGLLTCVNRISARIHQIADDIRDLAPLMLPGVAEPLPDFGFHTDFRQAVS